MFFFLTSTALLVCINQCIVGQINFPAAVAATSPDNRAASVISFGGKLRHQSSKSPACNIAVGVILFVCLAGASGFSAGDQQGSLDDTFFSAGTLADPPGSTMPGAVGFL